MAGPRPFFALRRSLNLPLLPDDLSALPSPVADLGGLEAGFLPSGPLRGGEAIERTEPAASGGGASPVSTPTAAPPAPRAPATGQAAAGLEHDPHSPIKLDLVVPVSGIELEVSPGEMVLFGVYASDRDRLRPSGSKAAWTEFQGKGPYEIKLTVTGDAEFNSAGSGDTEVVKGALRTGTVALFVEAGWKGTPKIKVKATIKDLEPAPAAPHAGSVADPDVAIDWTIVKRPRACPTGLTRVSGPGATWTASPVTYGYQATPDVGSKGGPDYVRQTVLETFGTATALNFTMSDVKDSWKAAHPGADTPDKVAAEVFGSGDNGTFVFDSNDQIFDLHSGFGDASPFKDSAFEDADGVGFRLAQEFRCAGKVIATATIDRRLTKANGIEIKKTGP